MKIRVKVIFPVALGASLLAFPARAATANASANAAPAGTGTNVNLDATMTALFGNPVIARGKGFEIKQSDLDEVMTGIKAGAAMRNQAIPPSQMKIIESQMLDQLIRVQLLLQQATDADRAAGKKTADAQMKTLLEQAGSPEALNRQFMALGMSMRQLRQRLEQDGTAQAVVVRELKISVTDAEARKSYDDHPADFELPERVRIAQIFLSTQDPLTGAELSDADKAAKKKEIEDILKRARAGADFSNLVEQYSEDAASKDKGGVYTIARGRTFPEFEAAAFSLETNQISDVVTTASGYHLIKLLGKLPAQKLAYDSVLPNQTPPDALTVSDYIKTVLTNQKVAQLAPPYLNTLRKEAGVEILDPDLNAAEQQIQAETATNAPAAPEGK
ncbi:MAG TPA: peptidylprolyl isomerase [Candidatus Sulfopaludibacter sp.]|nr:peptidylprolyl isomerase [Candidatus Sulfopaludibacter sp.]